MENATRESWVRVSMGREFKQLEGDTADGAGLPGGQEGERKEKTLGQTVAGRKAQKR